MVRERTPEQIRDEQIRMARGGVFQETPAPRREVETVEPGVKKLAVKLVANAPALERAENVPPRGAPRIQQVFLDADLRPMARGLVETCLAHGIDVTRREHGELIVFLNRKRDYIKVLACNRSEQPVLCCYRLPHGQVYDLSIIGEIPAAFRLDGTVDISKAMRQAVEAHLGEQRKKAVRVAEEIKRIGRE